MSTLPFSKKEWTKTLLWIYYFDWKVFFLQHHSLSSLYIKVYSCIFVFFYLFVGCVHEKGRGLRRFQGIRSISCDSYEFVKEIGQWTYLSCFCGTKSRASPSLVLFKRFMKCFFSYWSYCCILIFPWFWIFVRQTQQPAHKVSMMRKGQFLFWSRLYQAKPQSMRNLSLFRAQVRWPAFSFLYKTQYS